MTNVNKNVKKKKSVKPYPFETRLKIAKLFLEEGYSAALLNEEFGVSKSTINYWVKTYREFGEEGLKPGLHASTGSKVPPAVKNAIIEVKKKNPDFGQLRITDILKRFFSSAPVLKL